MTMMMTMMTMMMMMFIFGRCKTHLFSFPPLISFIAYHYQSRVLPRRRYV